jgi:serine/threonine protein kinase
LALQIAEGLGAAHRAGVIHRDIKPDNIMVVGQNGLEEIKLMDFGIARLRDGASTTQLTRSGLIMGTPAYMAPEQAEGTEVSEKTDIYALGIVLYEMLSGTVPFKASTPAAVLVKQIQEAPVPLRKLRRDLPAALERTIMQALEKQPDRRQRNADEVADQLNKLSEKLRTDGATKGWTPTRTWNPFKKTPQESAESPDHKSWQIGKTVVHNEPALPTQVVAQPYAATQVLDRDETVTVSIPRPSWAVVKWGMVSLAALAFAGLIALGAYRYVSTGAPEIEKLAITSDKTNLSPRERITLAVNGTYSDKSVQPLSSGLDWHSSNDSVARVNDKGEVEGQQEGVVVITARYGGRISSSIDLVVKAIKPPPPAAPTLTALTIAAPKHELNPNERTVVQLSGRYSDGTDKAISKGVTWTISDHSVATVDATGRVTGRKSGAVNLSAEFNGISSAPITLTVKASVPEPAKSQAPKPATASATAEPKPSKPLGLSDETLRNSVELANVHYNNGDYQKAISILDGVLKTNPDYGLARSLRNKAQKACIAEGTCVK